MIEFSTYALIVCAASVAVLAGLRASASLSGAALVGLGFAWAVGHVGAAAMLGATAPFWVSSLLVVGSAVLAGRALSRVATSAGALVALALTASVVDIVSFSGGVTRWILTSESAFASRVLRYLAVTTPTPSGLAAVVGIGDLAFLGAFHVGLEAVGRSARSAAVGLVVALLVALAVGLMRGGAFGIPFMSVVVIGMARSGARQSVRESHSP
jgi:hypothetical protein